MLTIATGTRRGECCGLKWKDVDFSEKSIHICRNAVKVTGEDIPCKRTQDRRRGAVRVLLAGDGQSPERIPLLL